MLIFLCITILRRFPFIWEHTLKINFDIATACLRWSLEIGNENCVEEENLCVAKIMVVKKFAF